MGESEGDWKGSINGSGKGYDRKGCCEELGGKGDSGRKLNGKGNPVSCL